MTKLNLKLKGIGKGSGWHNDSMRHTRAAKYGTAGEFYKSKSCSNIKLKNGSIPDSQFNKIQLKEGMKVEKEHSDNPQMQKQITKAHLKEDKDYYKKLKIVEDYPKGKLFTKGREIAYAKEDAESDTPEFKQLYSKHNAKIIYYKGVVVSENYIPLFRFDKIDEQFTETEPNTIYILNFDDLSESKFEQIVNEVKQFPEVGDKNVEVSSDPGGF